MASSSSQSSGTQYPMSFPLYKLSFCTTKERASKMTWTHLPAQDSMFTVFDQVRKAGLGGAIMEMHLLKLIRGADVLEEIDLHELKYQAHLDQARRRSQSLQESSLLTVVIIKRPFVALRYQLSNGQIRRLQMNFRTDQGYEATVSVFESLGLPITDRNPTAEPPASSQHPTSHLTYPNQSPPNSQGRYSSAQLPIAQAAANPGMMPISSFANSAIASYKDRVPHANTQDSYPVRSRQVMTIGNTGGLSSPSFPTPVSISPGGEIRPTNSQSYHPPLVSHFVQGAAHTDCSTSPNSVTRSSNSYGNEARPAISQDKYLSALRDIIPTAPMPSPEFTISRREIENQPTRSQNNGIAASGSTTYAGPNRSILPSSESTTRAATSCGNEFRPTSSAPEPYRDRPATAPLSLSQILPPKRVLPFPTKPAKPTTPTPNPEAAISSTPNELPAANTGPAKKRKTTTKSLASTEAPAADTRERIAKGGHQQPETGIVANEAPTDISSAAQTLLEAFKPGSPIVPSNTKTTPKPRAKPTPKPRKSAVPKSGTKKFATGCPPRRSSPKQSSSTSTRDRSLFGDDIGPAEFMSRLDTWIREYQYLPAPKPRDLIAGNTNNLAAYAAQPREERLAIIDDLVCEYLWDENFVKLLGDVYQSWRRVGI